jgi:hypothetical protein
MPNVRFDILAGFHVCPGPKLDGESEFRNHVKNESAVQKLELVWFTPKPKNSSLFTFSSRDRAVAPASIAMVEGASRSAPGQDAPSCVCVLVRSENRFSFSHFDARYPPAAPPPRSFWVGPPLGQ